MTVFNLCPHEFNLYNEAQFLNLVQQNPTTWVADAVEGEAILSLPSQGIARIATSTVENELIEGSIPSVKTQYGEISGIPETATLEDTLIVSLPTQSMAKASGHPYAQKMASPYKVVRLASNTSTVLGAMGLSFQ